jgi:hypothetical protein
LAATSFASRLATRISQTLTIANIFTISFGCTYNMPAAYESGVFEYCESDNQLPAGIYVLNGVSE